MVNRRLKSFLRKFGLGSKGSGVNSPNQDGSSRGNNITQFDIPARGSTTFTTSPPPPPPPPPPLDNDSARSTTPAVAKLMSSLSAPTAPATAPQPDLSRTPTTAALNQPSANSPVPSTTEPASTANSITTITTSESTTTAPAATATAPTAATNPTPASSEKQLTPKELKEKKKAEKLARRVHSKAAAPPTAAVQKKQQQKQSQPKGGRKASQSDGPVSTIRLGTGGPGAAAKPSVTAAIKEAEFVAQSSRDNGLVGLLKDLESEKNEKKKKSVFGIDNAHPDVHPAILTLGMQINKNVIVGSSARCMGFLLAIKRVIEDYETPPDSSLNRHLPGAYLSHQINYLISARPMATAMGNTIRWLKTVISNMSPDVTDEVAKKQLVEKIESFIHEKITAADKVIVNTACDHYIHDQDVIVTFSKSQVVENTLLEAKRRGKSFRVVVVDSRPLEEARNLLTSLCQASIDCEYVHLYALDYVLADATKVLLGANAVMANGALYSRAGSAVTAVAAKSVGIPVLVLCETIKFSEKINIDGIVNNELGSPELLVSPHLSNWRSDVNTTVVSFMYDVTPAECLSIVICEHGCVTPEGVSGVLRVSGMDR